jgi:hypothetical protein
MQRISLQNLSDSRFLSWLFLLAANLFVAWQLFSGQAQFFDVAFAYWVEMLVLVMFAILKFAINTRRMITGEKRIGIGVYLLLGVFFIAVAACFFFLTYGSYIYSQRMLPADMASAMPGYAKFVQGSSIMVFSIMFFASHFYSFIANFLMRQGAVASADSSPWKYFEIVYCAFFFTATSFIVLGHAKNLMPPLEPPFYESIGFVLLKLCGDALRHGIKHGLFEGGE